MTTMTTTVNVVSGGIIKFDGGTMFGQVPKAYWESKIPTDRKNRITSRRKRGMAPGLSPRIGLQGWLSGAVERQPHSPPDRSIAPIRLLR